MSIKTDWTVVPSGKSEAAWTKFRNELGPDGSRVIIQLEEDTSFRRKLAAFARRGGIVEPASLKLTRYILGQNSFFPEDWVDFYGAQFSKKQLREVGKFPWGEDVFNSTCQLCKETVRDCHFAHLGFDKLNGQLLTILKWHELHPVTGSPRFYFDGSRNMWYRGHDFAEKFALNFRWYLTHKEIVPGSTNKDYTNQVATLPPEYEVPTAVEEVQKNILVFRKTGAWPNFNVYARTKDVTSGGRRVVVGIGGDGGLRVDLWDGNGLYSVGLGASRKLPS